MAWSGGNYGRGYGYRIKSGSLPSLHRNSPVRWHPGYDMRSVKNALPFLDPIPENVNSLPSSPTSPLEMLAWPTQGDDYHGSGSGGGYLNPSYYSGLLPYSVHGAQSARGHSRTYPDSGHVGRSDDNWETRSVDRDHRSSNSQDVHGAQSVRDHSRNRAYPDSVHVGRSDDNWETRSVDRNHRSSNSRGLASQRKRNSLPPLVASSTSFDSLPLVSSVKAHSKNNVNDVNNQLSVHKTTKKDSQKFINAYEGSVAGASVGNTKDSAQAKSQKASSSLSAISAPAQTERRKSSQITFVDVNNGQPFAAVDIPPNLLQRGRMNRLKRMLAPITMFLIVIALLVALVAAIYFAVALKESQERQIALLQATLDLAMIQQSRDYNSLTSTESQQLQAAYCHEVDDVFATTTYNSHYRGCDVNTLNNQRIVFHLFFLKESTVDEGDEIVEVLARHSNSQTVEGETSTVTFANITVDISEATRSVKLESTTQPEDFYGEDSQRPMEEPTESPIAIVQDDSGTSLRVNDSICATISEANIAPHPSSCSHYITCANLKAEVMQCPPNLVFDPENLLCDIPSEELPCREIEPCTNLNGGYFADPYNCHHYVVCDHGDTIVQTCGYDKVWDDVIKTCVPRERGTEC